MEAKLPQVSRARLVDDVRRSLEDAILSGQIQPGERLAEAWIAEQLHVSRTTVREALLMLEREGHVVSTPRRGTHVMRLSPEDAFDLGLVRALLEGFAVKVLCANPDEALIDQLQTKVEEMQACRLPEDLPRLIQIDLAFHKALAAKAGSRRLVELFSSLDGQIGALYVRAVEKYGSDSQLVAASHHRLLEDIRSWDPVVAQQAVTDHYLKDDSMRSIYSAAVAAITKGLSDSVRELATA